MGKRISCISEIILELLTQKGVPGHVVIVEIPVLHEEIPLGIIHMLIEAPGSLRGVTGNDIDLLVVNKVVVRIRREFTEA